MGSIELADVDMVYPDGFEAVRHVDLSIPDGEFHVLLGPSGCGKSTVLRLIAGLETPTNGEIRLDGRRANEVAPRHREIAMAFQEHALYPHMTVAENLGFPLKMSGVHAKKVAVQVREVARTLGLDDVLGRKPSRLSGGQQQRVSLGRSIIRRPRIFLMDEPLSNLDSRLRIESRSAILRLQRRLSTTTVFVTHDQAEAMALADTITVMRSGVVVQSGPPLELYDRPVDLFVAQFLGSPAMNVFAAKVTAVEAGWALVIGSQVVRLDGDPRNSALWSRIDGRTVAVGVRPDALRPVTTGGLAASVQSTELWGNDRLVNAVIDAPGVTASASGIRVNRTRESPITAFTSGDDVLDLWQPFSMGLDARSVHLFDLASGVSLDLADGETSDVLGQANATVRVT
ncbi:MAG: ABC transporter ATP-binding protein [Ilumatobacter sp.]|uniref:ABC transporter ATP-binding protein n=1 Tax=Ilumatobacter sp. TaxID=1967498 RepID=UPI003C78D07D